MHAARNVLLEPRLVPGGGATEMELSAQLTEKAKSIEGIAQWPYRAVAKVMIVSLLRHGIFYSVHLS